MCLHEKQIKENATFLPGCFFIAYKNQLFSIQIDGNVREHTGFAAFGSGSEFALGSLQTSKEIDWTVKDQIINAFISSERHYYGIEFPIAMMNTEDNKDIIIKRNYVCTETTHNIYK